MSVEQEIVHPRHVLCALGTGLDLDAVERIVAEVGGAGFVFDREYSGPGHDPRMSRAFEASGAGVSFTDADWAAVEGHDSVAYVLSPPMSRATSVMAMSPPITHGNAFDVAWRTLEVAAALLGAGATAVKNESSGLAHGRDRWLDLAGQVEGASPPEMSEVFYRAWVRRPVSAGSVLYTCGMHLLGVPDVELEIDGPAEEDLEARLDLIDNLALYLLAEWRAVEMSDGEGFRLAPDAPRWLLHHRPCRRYEEDDFFFNPYGYWRLSPA